MKAIQISDETHHLLKDYCKDTGKLLGKYVDFIIRKELANWQPIDIDKIKRAEKKRTQ